jgi:hypothetical protein
MRWRGHTSADDEPEWLRAEDLSHCQEQLETVRRIRGRAPPSSRRAPNRACSSAGIRPLRRRPLLRRRRPSSPPLVSGSRPPSEVLGRLLAGSASGPRRPGDAPPLAAGGRLGPAVQGSVTVIGRSRAVGISHVLRYGPDRNSALGSGVVHSLLDVASHSPAQRLASSERAENPGPSPII